MSMKKIRVQDLPVFDAAEYLDSEEAIAEYLNAIAEEDDEALLVAALGDIAKARGMSEIAKASGMTREALYKALRPGSHPRYSTIRQVMKALGIRTVYAADAHAH